ncbi:MAG: hypothetical protein QOC64_1324 [Solirubrobacteraceae bacterium]|jgi:hypothetical protein|nr:hypothetical protein [Solirubrobacteraceae bacterium]
MSSQDRADRVQQVESQVNYHRERLALFRSRMPSSGYASHQRLRDLEYAYREAQERLALVRSQTPPS